MLQLLRRLPNNETETKKLAAFGGWLIILKVCRNPTFMIA